MSSKSGLNLGSVSLNRCLSSLVLTASLFHALTFGDNIVFKGNYVYLLQPGVLLEMHYSINERKEGIVLAETDVLSGVHLQ